MVVPILPLILVMLGIFKVFFFKRGDSQVDRSPHSRRTNPIIFISSESLEEF